MNEGEGVITINGSTNGKKWVWATNWLYLTSSLDSGCACHFDNPVLDWAVLCVTGRRAGLTSACDWARVMLWDCHWYG